MTNEAEQRILDVISLETKKKKNLDLTLELERAHEPKGKPSVPNCHENTAAKMSSEQDESQRETEERRYLIQSVINEASAGGNPIPPSLIKLLNHMSGEFL